MKSRFKVLKAALVLLLTLLVVALSFSVWSERYTEIMFRAEADAPVRFSVFYTTKAGQKMHSSRRISAEVKEGASLVKIRYSEPYLHLFRLDFDPVGGKQADVRISDLHIVGKQKYTVRDFAAECVFREPRFQKAHGSLLTVSATRGVDAFIQVRKPVEITAAAHVDWLIFISIGVVSFFFAYKVVFYLFRFKETGNVSRKDIALLSVFFVCICYPLTNMNEGQVSETENRTLAEKPDINRIFDREYSYGNKFEQWVSDRFAGRSWLIALHNKTRWGQSETGNSSVLKGKDGWLFYTKDDNINCYRNAQVLTAKELANIAAYLSDLDEWCKKNNKEFYYFIAPNKHKVYGEYYRYLRKQAPDAESRTRKLVAYLKQHTQIKVIYPLDALLDAKKDAYLYYKHDTHWTPYGAHIGYLELMKVIDPNQEYNWFRPEFGKKVGAKGDMEKMFPACQPDADTPYLVKYPTSEKVQKKQLSKNFDEDVIYTNPDGRRRLFFLGDSFRAAMAPFLSETFAEIRMMKKAGASRHQFTKSDLEYIQKHADVVVLQHVERFTDVLAKKKFPEL